MSSANAYLETVALKDPDFSGRITSGIPSPSTGKNIAMALIKNGHHKKDTKVQVEVRQKMRPAQIAKLPFVPNKFYRGNQ